MSRSHPDWTHTEHSWRRASGRRISSRAINAAICWGRRTWTHGDRQYRLDRRSVQRAAEVGVDVRGFEGVTVILTPDQHIRTVWCNRNPRRIRR